VRLSANQHGVLVGEKLSAAARRSGRLRGNDKTVFFEGRRVAVGGYYRCPGRQTGDENYRTPDPHPASPARSGIKLTVLRQGKRLHCR